MLLSCVTDESSLVRFLSVLLGRCYVLVSVVIAATTLCASRSGRLVPLALSLKRSFVQGVARTSRFCSFALTFAP